MESISLIIAFSAGILSFLSPCVLPLIPAYISYLTGTALSEINTGQAKLNLMLKSFGFVLGFSVIFIVMGASVSTLGQVFAENQYIIRKVGGVIIILMGLHLMGLLKINFLYREKRLFPFADKKNSISSVFIGMAFAAGWTPCIGPILSTILLYASSMETIWSGIILLLVYSLGLAIPFLLTALAINSFARFFNKFSRYLPAVSVISGILIILTGLLIFFNKLNILSHYFDFFNL
ncbi:MAG: cytochrome c biogenesis protein CcdA [Eubacteriales bacterium]